MQRTALQGHPTTLDAGDERLDEGRRDADRSHPSVPEDFDELRIGETFITPRRTIAESDVGQFAGLSGDFFYAHMDEIAAKESDLRRTRGPRVLRAERGGRICSSIRRQGPVLANYGLERLRFTKPVYPGDTIQVRLTCKQKTAKEPRRRAAAQGVVEWDVEVTNQNAEAVAVYSILTLVRRGA